VTAKPERWSGRLGFIFATIGSAVGIGSIWKFPYEVGANGGSAFVLFYLLGLVSVVVPLMLAEFAIGRRGRGDPATSIRIVARSYGRSARWRWIGTLGVVTGFLILSFYAVIGGWTAGYAWETAVRGLPGTEAHAVRARHEAFLAAPLRMLGYHAAFIGATALVVARGVSRGIEAASKVLMPMLMALMAGLAAYSIVNGDVDAALRFLFRLDLDAVTPEVALDALGLGFFSIGVGLGMMITYGAYSGEQIDLKQVAIVSVAADTAISLLAGLAVFPIVFAHGLDPATGTGLVFVTLPLAFAGMPFGTAAAVAFFLLLFVAALASAISLLEIVVALLMRRFGLRRSAAAAIAAGTCYAAGIPTVFSFNLWAAWHPLRTLAGFEHSTWFEALDYLTSNTLLPAAGFALAVFAGWALPDRLLTEELGLSRLGVASLRFALRYLGPGAIAVVTLAPILLA
jgi:NSS family neurotransmitter:Na+ symporter